MSREIKFRAWHSAGEMLDWDQIKRHSMGFIFDYGTVTLMQFTGLRDKNGTEIYEGDILDVTEPMACSGFQESKYLGTNTWVNRFRHVVEFSPSGLQLASHYARISEVIGNIYEHPALLEKVEA